MIVREREDTFILISQHDHAKISGDITKYLNKDLLGSNHIDDVIAAAYQHDRGWIALDQTPRWNGHAPYSFMNYPLIPKLRAYHQGLNEVENMNKYACMICSLHYCSFSYPVVSPEVIDFLKQEEVRQERIINAINDLNMEDSMNSHLRILQFSDRLSLYVCLNEPGTMKENEHTWYKEGIKHSEILNTKEFKPIVTNWVNQNEISVTGFPFESEFQTKVKYKELSKSTIRGIGIEQAFEEAEWKEHEIIFIR